MIAFLAHVAVGTVPGVKQATPDNISITLFFLCFFGFCLFF